VLGIREKSAGVSALAQAFELLDHMATKGVLHKNTAARHKAKLTRHVNSLQA
jgi:small subunit ribosomal protein S20